MLSAGFQKIDIATPEPLVGYDDGGFTELSDQLKQAWADELFKHSNLPDLLRSSCHVLYIGRKP